VFLRPDGSDIRLRVLTRFANVISAPEQPVIIAVDIPIGLPECSGPGGRAAENAVRPLLGARQSSVFSVPSRAAIYAAEYRAACRIAAQTSLPSRHVSKQLFMIAPKIREVDALLREMPALAARVFETHPELAFWRMNGTQPVPDAKRVKGRAHGPGLALRRALLVRTGVPESAVEAVPPAGAKADDLIDALACAVVARRLDASAARPFPDPFPRDTFGLPMAIWA